MQVPCLWLPSSSSLLLTADCLHPFGCINSSQIYFWLSCICMLSGSYLLLFDISLWVGCHHNPHIELSISRTEFSRLPVKPSLLPSPPALLVTLWEMAGRWLTSLSGACSSRSAKMLLSRLSVATPLGLFLGSQEYIKFKILAFESLL